MWMRRRWTRGLLGFARLGLRGNRGTIGLVDIGIEDMQDHGQG